MIVDMLETLKKLQKNIDVPLNSGISEAKVKEINEITSQFTQRVLTNNRR